MSELFWPTTWWGWLIVAIAVVLMFLPPKYDPAVRFKEAMDNWARRQIDKRRGGGE